MIGNLLRVSNDELESYLRDSKLLEERVYSDDADIDDQNPIDIDKSWDGIHFLLTGKTLDEINSADPLLSSIVFGDQPLDENQDMGYGPARYNTKEQVRQITKVFEELPITKLKEQYDAKKMSELEIYPTIWDEPEAFDYIVEYYEKLKQFYQTAAASNQEVVAYIN